MTFSQVVWMGNSEERKRSVSPVKTKFQTQWVINQFFFFAGFPKHEKKNITILFHWIRCYYKQRFLLLTPLEKLPHLLNENCLHTWWFQSVSRLFFLQAFKIVVDSWDFIMLLLYILWNDRPIFMISDSNKQLQQQLEYTLLKPDCHSWWISKI